MPSLWTLEKYNYLEEQVRKRNWIIKEESVKNLNLWYRPTTCAVFNTERKCRFDSRKLKVIIWKGFTVVQNSLVFNSHTD